MNCLEKLQKMDVQRALFGMFFSFSNHLQAAGDTFYDEITCKQFFFLICLNLLEDCPPTLNELAQVMQSSHQNIKQMAKTLEAAGYVELRRDSSDRRKTRIYKTQKAGDLQRKYRTQSEQFFEAFYAGISAEDLLTTFRVLNQLDDNLTAFKTEENDL
jgi:DNA-binding MarR family transcriptional regulator